MRRLFFIVTAALVALPAFFAGAAIPEKSAALKGAAYILSQQGDDGGYGSAGAGPVADAIYAVRAAGFDPNKDVRGGKTPADYLKAVAAAQTKPASAAKAALAAKALGLNPKAVAGTDLIAAIDAGLVAATGRYASDDFSNAIAVLGLVCTGNTVPDGTTAALRAAQLTDGGWGFGGSSDPDTTGIALQALLATGVPRTDAAVTKAIGYLKGSQGKDGGWGFDPSESNVSSTAYSVQALIAAGEAVESAAYTKTGVTPVAFLLSQQNANGSFKGFDPLFAANQAIPALVGRTFCNAPDTPVTETRPAVPAATPSPSPSTPSAATPTSVPVAPRPPSTGAGLANDGDGLLTVVAIAGLVLLVTGAAALARVSKR